ncbi:MAG: transaldolase family protein [Microbacterium sp.]
MLYIDAADRARLAPLLATGLFAGVTTNPIVLQRAGLSADDLPALHSWLVERGCRRFYAQATGDTIDAMRATAARIADIGEDVVVKLVATHEGLTVARELVGAGREVLLTAVYHPSQVLLAAAVGVQEIAPYVGRASDAGRDGIRLVSDMAGLGTRVRILAASLRSTDQVVAALAAGAADATVSASLADTLLTEKLTLEAAAQFEAIARESEGVA